jgi:hypothetical protein
MHIMHMSGNLQVSLGWGHALARTTDGLLYSWGYAANGRLGFWPEDYLSTGGDAVPHAIEQERDSTIIQDLADNQVQEQMESESRPVLAWKPCFVTAFASHYISDIVCGFDHSLALTGDHEEVAIELVYCRSFLSLRLWSIDLFFEYLMRDSRECIPFHELPLFKVVGQSVLELSKATSE